MNKTPIQELIDYYKYTEDYDAIRAAKLFLEKEKQFAFDCFKAGESYCSYHCGQNLEESPDFEQFYSQYVE